ncbi:MAG: sel1 repeat family protein [gamma proteobacterium symbiont of Bathyaustriella thionipta]|nr:sel1 repeat family protein [gamma proteobacterium symbiont of Bathyaustriella thionipta]MCU7956279.1 sel1 repeat family protein [gamma proteobacterium symbiont of Bathyaustriella thionipta]
MQKEDFYEASEVCRAMADKGDINAQFSLAVMYYQGNGLMADQGEALKWMRKAALQNHHQAQYNLGLMIASGHGSNVDLIEAYAWLKIAADNGYSFAADSVKQLAAELSSSEKQKADEKIKTIKKSVTIK